MPRTTVSRTGLRLLLVLVGALVTLVSSYLVVRDVHWHDVWRALRESDLRWVAPSFAALAAGVFLRVVRWRALFAPASRPPLRAASEALLVGYLFNNVLPVRAGEAARVVVLHRTAGTSRAESAGTVVVERAFDIGALLLLLFVAVPWLPEVTWLHAAALLAVVLVVGIGIVVVLLVVFGDELLLFAARPFTRLSFVPAGLPERLARNLTLGLHALVRTRSALVAFLWTIASWVSLAISSWLLMLGFDLGLSPGAGLLTVIAIGLAMILPSSPGALGVFEGATVVALGAYGVPNADALSYALVLHVLNFFPFIVAGLWALHVTTGAAAFGRRRTSRVSADAARG